MNPTFSGDHRADLLEFLRRCGVALCLAGEAASRIPDEMEAVADAYGVRDVEFLVVPTGVFVRVAGSAGVAAGRRLEERSTDPEAPAPSRPQRGEAPPPGVAAGRRLEERSTDPEAPAPSRPQRGEAAPPGVTVDFMNADGPALRLDQVDSVYKLMAEVKTQPIPPREAIERLDRIVASPPRFGAVMSIVGYAVLTVGLGLLVVRDGTVLLSLAVLGLAVGVLRTVAERVQVLSLALPVIAAMLVTGLAYEFSQVFEVDTAALLIPPLAAFLPGAVLTLGAQEMATRSMISGASRIVSGIYMLLLLTFGIFVGAQIAGTAPFDAVPSDLGWWGPLAGVLVFGIGVYVNSSAPKRSLAWLLLTLLVTFGAQQLGGYLGGSLFSAFTGGLVVVPVATVVQRLKGPPAQVAVLPAFWLLVPGALGLAGVTGLVALGPGSQGLVNAFLTVVAVALGVLVGSSLTTTATARSRLFTSRSA